MQNKIMCSKKNNIILLIVFSTLLFLMYSLNIGSLNMISIIGDEFGYWASGAFLAGYDWSEVASYNSYYSFGYSIWLALILKFATDPILSYKIAIILNSFFIIISYLILYNISFQLKLFRNNIVSCVVCFAIMLFPGIFFSSQTTQCETALILFFLIEIYLLLKFLEKDSIPFLILLIINTFYLYVIHQRTIVVMISLYIFIILYTFNKRKKWTDLILAIILGICLFVGVSKIKDIFLAELYKNGKAVYSNNYSGQVGKIKTLFSLEGIQTFLFGLLGKIFYLGVSTFGIFYYSIWCLAHKIIRNISDIRNKKNADNLDHSFLLSIFILLIVCGTICISTLQLLDNKRIDTLIYGRYSEYLVPIILLIGLYYAPKKNNGYCVIMGIEIIIGLLVCYQLYQGNYSKLYPNNIAAFGRAYYNTWNKESFILGMTVLSAFLCIVVTFILNKNRNYLYRGLAIAIIGAIWIYSGYDASNQQLYVFTSDGKNLELYTFIHNLPNSMKIYYCADGSDDDFAYLNVDYIQYLAYDRTIYMLDSTSDFEKISDSDYLIIPIDVDFNVMNDYVLLRETSMFKLLCKKNSESEYYYINHYD